MIGPMRRILPWFLMFLLALRGLTGIAMATEAVPERALQTAQVAQALAAASHSAHGLDASPAAAHGAASVMCATAVSADCSAHQDSPACSACGMCHSAVLATPALAPAPVHTGSAVQPAAATPFASALAALATKPPIG